MIFTETALPGTFTIDVEPRRDQRGFFARTFCGDEFARRGLPAAFVQCSISFNKQRGVLRGMHYQAEPRPEGKLVRCTRGAIWDVIVDLRPDSSNYRRWVGVELTEENGRAVCAPGGFAHGFQTLVDNSEVFYQMTEFHDPELARGVRWDDPAFGIAWPLPHPILSERDAAYPDLSP
jgi:dTDP-4-dehydrorhamnose 3,5-epimerase